MPHDARGRVAILLTLSLLAGCPSPDGDDPPAGDDDTGEEPADGTVRVTDAGTLHGFVQDGSVAFLGVPFAAAPVGELRWQLPQPLVPWDGELDATTYAEWCTQTVDDDEERSLREQAIGSEDCLYLNVWTPEDADPEDRLPVIFFVHGGGNIYGGATEPIGSLVHASPGHEDVPLYGGAGSPPGVASSW